MQASSPTSGVKPTIIPQPQVEACLSPTTKMALAIIASLGSFIFLPFHVALGHSAVIITGAVIYYYVNNPHTSLPPSIQKTREIAEPLSQPQSQRNPPLAITPSLLGGIIKDPVASNQQADDMPLGPEVANVVSISVRDIAKVPPAADVAQKESARVQSQSTIPDVGGESEKRYVLDNGIILDFRWYVDPFLSNNELIYFTKNNNGISIYCGNPQREISLNGNPKGDWFQLCD